MLIKTKSVRARVIATQAEVNLALFEYIDGFYSGRRIQKRLRCLSLIQFEEKWHADEATTEPADLNTHQPALTGRSMHPNNAGMSVQPSVPFEGHIKQGQTALRGTRGKYENHP
ncbi:hypothetical protein ABTY00_35840 [Streptomyces microflavus]|uniref:hypothetical protein n=1 Tax=Streptomyces microflavus TaxID=1919 RepID=UPI0033310853